MQQYLNPQNYLWGDFAAAFFMPEEVSDPEERGRTKYVVEEEPHGCH
jgi:hypothetical protein